MLQGILRSRLDIKDLAAETVQCLRGTGAQVVWALETPEIALGNSKRASLIEVLKYLTWQLLRLPGIASSDVQLNCLRVKAARTEEDWLSILGSSLEKLRRVYIVLDIEAMDDESSRNGSDFWPSAFLELLRELKD